MSGGVEVHITAVEWAAEMAAAKKRGADEVIAAMTTLADDLIREGDRATRRRSYPQGVTFRHCGHRIRARLRDLQETP